MLQAQVPGLTRLAAFEACAESPDGEATCEDQEPQKDRRTARQPYQEAGLKEDRGAHGDEENAHSDWAIPSALALRFAQGFADKSAVTANSL